MVKNESELWQYLKKNTPNIIWTKIENTSHLGTPDLLGYNKNKTFFTVELKVSKSNKLKFFESLDTRLESLADWFQFHATSGE